MTVVRWSGRETRALRAARRMSVRAFAAHLGVAVASVSNWERRGAGIRLRDETQEILDRDLALADMDVRARFDATLAASAIPGPRSRSGSLVSADGPGSALRAPGWVAPGLPPDGQSAGASRLDGPPAGPPSVDDESTADVLRRVRRRGQSVDADIVRRLKDEVLGVVTQYEELEHADFVPRLRRQRVQLEELIDGCGWPEPRRELFRIACAASGLLGYVAVGQGRFALAQAYCAEAFQLGEFAERSELMAWARGLQSFCAYYQQDYRAALDFAVNGIRSADAGPQGVRLAVNGAARAMGRLGDVQGVHRLVGEAQEMLADQDVPSGIVSSIGFGCYSAAQVASNAATAYLALGMPDRVRHHLDRAMPAISVAGSPWSRALVLIDQATAVVQSRQADLEQACGLVGEALDLAQGRPVISVQQRADEFVRYAVGRWDRPRELAPLQAALAPIGGTDGV
ncbi:Transcriptional regulator [Frankia sp. AiPs1]|uniref:helix-turn-helix domain-containing protein n=1 Tax=Frankia sp. AiPa1 TaxID=573492 RepID=UPI00202B9DD3|nr:transcriptional regulator [Frankia sp. AiPa1]MCL9758833.1 transcriptional regulator [Frankia sp. AiPa1]